MHDLELVLLVSSHFERSGASIKRHIDTCVFDTAEGDVGTKSDRWYKVM